MRQQAKLAWLLALCACSTALPPPHHLMALRSHPVARSIATQEEIGDEDPNAQRKEVSEFNYSRRNSLVFENSGTIDFPAIPRRNI